MACSHMNGRTTLTQTGVLVMARNHWIIFFNPIASSHGLVCFVCHPFFSLLSKPATDESTWVLLGFYPEKDGAQTDPCMLDVGHTVHGAGSPTSVRHHCSPC